MGTGNGGQKTNTESTENTEVYFLNTNCTNSTNFVSWDGNVRTANGFEKGKPRIAQITDATVDNFFSNTNSSNDTNNNACCNVTRNTYNVKHLMNHG